MPFTVQRITVYPVKSLPGVDISTAEVAQKGHLRNDRRYAIFNSDGTFVNGKAEPRVHRLGMRFDFDSWRIELTSLFNNDTVAFSLQHQKTEINRWLSDFFNREVELREDAHGRFLDDPDVSHVTLVSFATLRRVIKWFGITGEDECHARFRSNLVIDGFSAFEEDRLFRAGASPVSLRIGEVFLHGVQPRPRCVVPTRHPVTGEVTTGFQKLFAGFRKRELPEGSELLSFGHTYQLAVDMMIPASEVGKCFSIGDSLEIL